MPKMLAKNIVEKQYGRKIGCRIYNNIMEINPLVMNSSRIFDETKRNSFGKKLKVNRSTNTKIQTDVRNYFRFSYGANRGIQSFDVL